MKTANILPALLVILAPVCFQATGEEKSGPPPPPPFIVVNGLYNSGFELPADETTNPPKYGAYWVGAFAYEEGNPKDRVEQGDAYEGNRFLRLRSGEDPVFQKVVADPRWTEQTELFLAVRLQEGAVLEVCFRDGDGRSVAAQITPGASGLDARWTREGGGEGIQVRVEPRGEGASTWGRIVLPAGARFQAQHGTRPRPCLYVELRCRGGDGAAADVDEVRASVCWPRVSEAELARAVQEKILTCLETWFLPEGEGGLGLVDPDTGYVRVRAVDVVTGKKRLPAQQAGLHTLYELLLRWIRYARARGLEEEVTRWTPYLERFTATLLERNFDPDTGLPRVLSFSDLAPRNDDPVTAGSYVDFLLDAREAIQDPGLKKRCLDQARRIADTLLALQQAHDLPPARVRNTVRWNPNTKRFEGEWPNWYGHLPHRFTPKGEIEPPARFNTSWAILSGRNYWYHLFKSAAAIARVHALAPREGDLAVLQRVLSRYHRDWDAARYDLENDTDDHYGYLMEDLLPVVRACGKELPRALAIVQQATDHRLERDKGGADHTLWIQAVRLGTPCAGDSPRALQGLLDLYDLPPALNPETSGLPLYRDALLELARNDLKGRQLTNGQFTESFFKQWEMVCICFRGSFQGDCRNPPPGGWHGDVGDLFGGPPTNAIKAQSIAFRAAPASERPYHLAALGLIDYVTEHTLGRPYGYLHGLDEATARRYELPEKYVIGLSRVNADQVGYALTWAKLLPYLENETRAEAKKHGTASPHEGEGNGETTQAEVSGDPELHRLLEAFRRGDTAARRRLAAAGDRAVPGLEALLLDPTAPVPARLRAADLLGAIAGPAAVDALVRALQDPNFNVKRSAALALGRTGGPRAREALSRTATEDPFFFDDPVTGTRRWPVREAARQALRILEARKAPAAPSFPLRPEPEIFLDDAEHRPFPPVRVKIRGLPWPFPGEYEAQGLLRNYQHPVGGRRVHGALSFFQPAGTAVRAVEEGYVVSGTVRGEDRRLRPCLVLARERGGAVGWCYEGLDPASLSVREGERVKRKQVLGLLAERDAPGEGRLELAYMRFRKNEEGLLSFTPLVDPLYFFYWRDAFPPKVEGNMRFVKAGTLDLFPKGPDGVPVVRGKVDVITPISDQAYEGHGGDWMAAVVTLEITGPRSRPWRKLVLDQRGELKRREGADALYVPGAPSRPWSEGRPVGPRTYFLAVTHTEGDGIIEPADALQCWDTAALDELDLPRFPDGVYTVTVRAWDLLGNRGEGTARVRVKNAAPVEDRVRDR